LSGAAARRDDTWLRFNTRTTFPQGWSGHIRRTLHVPFISHLWPAAAHAVGETRSEFLAPASHRLVGDDNAAFSQEQLNIPQAEAADVI
jgi:hypothetical protein